jgi:hypothetical protein
MKSYKDNADGQTPWGPSVLAVFGDLRNIIAGIFLWVTVDGVGVENSN